ncbi:MAG: M61 family metallopeptidase [Acidobacteria bacterium]|nr:M61 family metallopeptidase [Acidobacteriota bacterium]MBI3422939.1 M61 family metallopeptidase [Acidobacteriota bacterium]
MPFQRRHHHSFRTFFSLALLLLAAASASAQSKVEYEIAFPNAVHHEAEVTVTFTGVPANKPLEARMSRSSPGRYALQEFSKNVYNVRATDDKGAPLAFTRPNSTQWNVVSKGGKVRISYTLFGDLGSGTFTGIDHTMAHLSIPATFMWARGFENAPITVRCRRPNPNWKIATQLAPTADAEVFTAPHMQYFMDSPTMLGDLKFREWPVQSNGKTYTIRLALNDNCEEKDVDEFAEMIKKVVNEQIAVFGETPDFDFGTYTFIANYVPQIGGDGMEHRNSTSLTAPRSIRGNPRANLGTVSHEFFHCWNVERLRPRTLEPFSFEDANVADGLWVGEGFTQYYGNLLMKRAGFGGDDANFGRGLGFTINAVVNSPGRRLHGPIEMSQQAVHEDGANSDFPTNSRNLFVSYYTYGAAVALGLDLTLRTKFPGKTLDSYMPELWQSYGKHQKNYNPAKPYTIADLKAALARLTGDAAFANDYFARYIEGRDVVDYGPLLAQAGFVYRQARPGKVWLDAQLREQNGALTIGGPTLTTGPLYQAGLDRGDKILSFDGQAVKTPSDVQAILEKHKPGDTIAIEADQRGVKRTVQLTFTEDPNVEVVSYESLNKEVTPAMKKLRAEWLGSQR